MVAYTAVIPARNEERHVDGAIESVLAQTAAPEAIVVVDDGSADRTAAVAGAFPRTRVVRHETSRGPSAARNSGVREAATPWVAFLDADDRWAPDKVARQAALASEGVGLVYCGARIARPDGTHVDEPAVTFPSHRRLRGELLCRNCVTGSGSGVLARRDLLVACGGFDESLRVSEDWDMWVRLAAVTRFAAVPEPLVTLVQRPSSLGSDPERIFQGAMAVIGKNAGLYPRGLSGALLRRRARGRAYERLGQGYVAAGRMRRARRCYLRAALLWPFRARVLHPLAKLLLGRLRQSAPA